LVKIKGFLIENVSNSNLYPLNHGIR